MMTKLRGEVQVFIEEAPRDAGIRIVPAPGQGGISARRPAP